MNEKARMVGSGRANLTGGAATITMPQEVVEKWDIDENGKDVVWFEDGPRLFAVPRSAVTVHDGGPDG